MGKLSVVKNIDASISKHLQVFSNESSLLKAQIQELEYKLSQQETLVIEKIKEVPVEVIREIKVIEEKIVEKEVQVIKEFPVYKETLIKEFVDRPIEIIKEVEKEIKLVPVWAYCGLLVQTLIIIVLLLK